MSLNDLLEAQLLRCKAECEAVNAELQQIVVGADPQNLVEFEPAIRAVLKRLKETADRLHDATIASEKSVLARVQ
jgi:hypothetical protein